ncbi:MAG: hypothetical protein HUK40_22165 [Desulfobacter sp.]|nr:hypothetical protein [Desulfobacter sp.]
MEKSEIIEMAKNYLCPGKIDTFGQIGIDLVIGKRKGPYIFDGSVAKNISRTKRSFRRKIYAA